MKKNNNVIPRNFKKIIARQEMETSGGQAGDVWTITPNENGGNCHGENQRTGQSYYIFKDHLRMAAFYTFLSIE